MKTMIMNLSIVALLLAVNIAKAQTFTTYTSANGLPSDNVTSVAVDAGNNKWFGTQSGVAKFDGSSWTTYTTANGLIDNYINCIAVDINNHIWAGTDLGVSTFDGTQWSSYTTANGLISDMVNYIAGAPDGSVWIGTTDGLSNFNGTTWKNFTTADGLPGNMISYVAASTSGNIWIGTFLGGLSMFNGISFTNFTAADSLPDVNIMAIAMGSGNTTWVGTYYGTAVYDSQNMWSATYRQKDGLFNNFVHDIAMDSKGTMWLGHYDIYTQDPGISKKTSTGWKTFTITDGLINSQLKRIAVDKSDHIWIATAAGVSKLVDANAGLADDARIALRVYPNPANEVLHLDGLLSSGRVAVKSVSGIDLINASLDAGSNTIAVSSLKPGMYLLQCTTPQGIYNGKLIIR